MHKRKNAGLVISMVTLLMLFILIAFGGFITYEIYIGNLSWNKAPPTTTVTPPGALNLNFVLIDPLAGGNISAATIKVYDMSDHLLDILTTAAGTGAVLSTHAYSPGTQLYALISKSGYVTYCSTFTVPSTPTSSTYNQHVYEIDASDFALGTFTIKCTDQFGNSYTSGISRVNFTTLVTTTVSLTFTIYNSVDNTGWWSSYDQLNNVNQNVAFAASTAASYITVTGGQFSQRGTTSYWSSIVSDGYPIPAGTSNPSGLTRAKVGNTYLSQGVTAITLTFGKGSLVTGTPQNFTSTLYDYFDSTYFAANGIGGPNAASLTTFNWDFGTA